MWELVSSGGFVMMLIIIASITSLTIIITLLLSLRRDKVIPVGAIEQARKLMHAGQLDKVDVQKVSESSMLGQVLAQAARTVHEPRHIMKESIEETGRHVVHEMEKYLPTLSTIAAIAPLLGLLGTVIGMIDVFSVITTKGVGDPSQLAGGISKALLTTAAGIIVAVPSMIFFRYFKNKINSYAVEMEKAAMLLVDTARQSQK